MSRRSVLLGLALPCLVLASWASSRVDLARGGSPLHPDVVLLDAEGERVLESGAPVSPVTTCGECHDTEYITGHSYHSTVGFDERFAPGSRDGVPAWNSSPGLFGRWDGRRYRRLTLPGEASFDLGVADWIRVFGDRHVGGGPALRARDGSLLVERVPGVDVDPETHVLDEQTGRPIAWDWERSGAVEMNCFLCHLARPDNGARIASLAAGEFAWAATATLAATELVEARDDGTWGYVADRFVEGAAAQTTLAIGDPRPENCGICHGDVHMGPEPVVLHLDQRHGETESKGQVFSPQPIRESALNLAGKEALVQPWDVHASRLVGCTACHTSLNNPTSFAEAERSRPRHLTYDARRRDIGEYLTMPSHHFTKGESAQGTVARRLDGTMRRCEDCHDAVAMHQEWLPNPRRHLTVMLCETCHVPRVEAPARRQVDWTVLTRDHGPRVEYRGIEGPIDDARSLIHGFEPVVLPRHQQDGDIRHAPHNLCTGWYWVGGDPDRRPVRLHDLRVAFFASEGVYHADLVAALDQDGDADLSVGELQLDTEAKVAAVARRLEAVGIEAPEIRGCIQPLSLHHGVVAGAYATQNCETCHSRDSRLTRPFELSSYVPAGAQAELVGDSNIRMPGRLYRDGSGRLLYEPIPTASGRYVIGHDRAGWIDVVGLLLVLGTLAGVILHAVMRRHHGRRRGGV